VTQNSAIKKAARVYAAENDCSYTQALRRVRHLHPGDRVKVVDGTNRKGVVDFVGDIAIDVAIGNVVTAYDRSDLEFIS
jgi:hypothetical protein